MSYQSKFTGAEIDAGIDAAKAALPKNGGTMMGALILAGDPAEDKAAVTKKYVDDAVKNIASTPGNDGEDGVSPTISVTEITGGHRITITDANGTQSFDIMNGKDGADGSGGDGSGDMLKAVYDADNDGTVDNAAKLGGKAASEYYGKENPPPYPVTSVNGMTGDVTIAGGGGSGDMQKAVYDVDGSGIVDDAERLGGKLPEEYADADHEHGVAYSTSEVNTNDVWIDGKPIYRCTVTKTLSKPSGAQTIGVISNMGTLVKLCGTMRYADSGGAVNSYCSIPNNNTELAWALSPTVGAGSGTIWLTFGSVYASYACHVYITVEYTKKTD